MGRARGREQYFKDGEGKGVKEAILPGMAMAPRREQYFQGWGWRGGGGSNTSKDGEGEGEGGQMKLCLVGLLGGLDGLAGLALMGRFATVVPHARRSEEVGG